LGAEGMPRRGYRYAPGMGWGFWNLFARVSAVLLAASFAVMLWDIWRTPRHGEGAGGGPWDGPGLARGGPSPPPQGNLRPLPIVRSRDPFWGIKYAPRTGPPTLEAAPPDEVHVPAPSILPPVLALALVLTGIGAVTRLAVVIFGGIAVLLGVIGFAFERPAFGEEETAGAAAEGVDNRKLGVWAFIGSESVFFAALISPYVTHKGRNVTGPVAETMLEIPLTSFSTFVLLTSSLLMVLALAAIQRGSERASRWWLLGTAALGLVFLGGQAY